MEQSRIAVRICNSRTMVVPVELVLRIAAGKASLRRLHYATSVVVADFTGSSVVVEAGEAASSGSH